MKEFTWFIPHYRTIKWSYDTCCNEAKKYTSRKQFQNNSGGAYRKALEEGWLDEFIPEKNVNQYCKKINDPNQYSMFFDIDDNV